MQNFYSSQTDDISVTEKWDTLWTSSFTPWDKGSASPALVELLVEKQFHLVPVGLTGSKGFVPGCGRGYDVALLAGLTAMNQKFDKVIGLDVSQKAIEEARQLHQGKPGNFEFILGDFFSRTQDWEVDGPFDVVYDYTVNYEIRLVANESSFVP